jgi:GT2 family glycosyltransferase
MYRRSVFDRIGYYDESFDACEDVEFNYRVFKKGLPSYISPRLAVSYHARPNIPSLWRQMMRYGRGRFRFIRKHPDAFTIGQIVPAVFLLWLAMGAVGSLVSRSQAAIFGFSLALYAFALLYFSAALGRRYGLPHFLLAPLAYLTIHLGLGAGFLTEALGSRSHKRTETGG